MFTSKDRAEEFRTKVIKTSGMSGNVFQVLEKFCFVPEKMVTCGVFCAVIMGSGKVVAWKTCQGFPGKTLTIVKEKATDIQANCAGIVVTCSNGEHILLMANSDGDPRKMVLDKKWVLFKGFSRAQYWVFVKKTTFSKFQVSVIKKHCSVVSAVYNSQIKNVCFSESSIAVFLENGTMESFFLFENATLEPRVHLKNVALVSSTFHNCFAAFLKNGDVETWGEMYIPWEPCNIPKKSQELPLSVWTNENTVIVLYKDERVVVWGMMGVVNSIDFQQLCPGQVSSNLSKVVTTQCAFCFCFKNGAVRSWGNVGYGGGFQSSANDCFADVFSNSRAFAGLTAQGKVVSWGDCTSGGTVVGYNLQLGTVKKLVSTSSCFIALNTAGECFLWGGCYLKTQKLNLQNSEKKVVDILADAAFVMIRLENGKVFTFFTDES